ncbi:MAG: protein kinase domain-containing protein [Spirulinaceae cyanobacterium]
MRQCLNPDCLQVNADTHNFCQKCGQKLLLVERYWAKHILGEGGFGRTFLAVDEFKPSKPDCVIKQFLPQAQGTQNVEKASELFAQEAQRLEELGQHPQIPELLAYFSFENRQYLVQEFIEGKTLQQELEDRGVFNEKEIISLLKDLLKVLQFVHHNQMIHRDIKPENIIRRQRDRKFILVDFGAAKNIQPQQITVTGTVIGSAEYCAPEQAFGKPQFSSDLYSLGVTCLYLLTQISPFDLYDVMEAEWAWRDFLQDNVVSDRVGQILDKLVVSKPKQRYQSATAVLTDLQSNSPIITIPKTASKTTQPIEFDPLNPPRYLWLEALLAVGKWWEADQETHYVMCRVANREQEGWVDLDAIANFPLEDLKTIDRLWLKYSQGRFGFSIQKHIYQSLGGTREYNREIWHQFGQKVQWRIKNDCYCYYKNLKFDRNSPPGHLPAYVGCKGRGAWGSVLFSRPDFPSTPIISREIN